MEKTLEQAEEELMLDILNSLAAFFEATIVKNESLITLKKDNIEEEFDSCEDAIKVLEHYHSKIQELWYKLQDPIETKNDNIANIRWYENQLNDPREKVNEEENKLRLKMANKELKLTNDKIEKYEGEIKALKKLPNIKEVIKVTEEDLEQWD